MPSPCTSPLILWDGDDKDLTFAEVKRLVEAASPALRLELDIGSQLASESKGKGRYLVARKALRAGDIVLREQPLFRGTAAGIHSKDACTEAFVALATGDGQDEEGEEEGEQAEADEDRLHPCSPLVDCIASILLTRQRSCAGGPDAVDASNRARAVLRLRQFAVLCRSAVGEVLPDGCEAELLEVLRPELRALTNEAELKVILHIMGSNRFVGIGGGLDVMFAGSMFEHSCVPNCFLSSFRGDAVSSELVSGTTRTLRAGRDIAEGEALCIDYLQLPDSYRPAAIRSTMLSRWGFACTCPRCVSLPEVECSFKCPACGSSELSPSRPGEPAEFCCLACKAVPVAEYTARCRAAEARFVGETCGDDDQADGGGSACDDSEILGRFHHAAFAIAWEYYRAGPSEVGLEAFREAAEVLADSISRLCGEDGDPLLLELYHTLALLEHGNLDAQRRFLGLEAAVTKRFYPEVAQRQEHEVMKLIHGPEITPEEAEAAWKQYDSAGEVARKDPADDMNSMSVSTGDGLEGMD